MNMRHNPLEVITAGDNPDQNSPDEISRPQSCIINYIYIRLFVQGRHLRHLVRRSPLS
jgi:hypothetical protein